MVASGETVALADASVKCFNPLHCGAVVASEHPGKRPVPPGRVSIPFIAGQWSLRRNDGPDTGLGGDVSIPFIAGQWSLPPSAGPRSSAPRCFNPLHCGAVVASRPDRPAGRPTRRVSIPFIAGQWSLRNGAVGERAPITRRFQSPSLRGSGRFSSRRRDGRLRFDIVSIPFIAGQWSLRGETPSQGMRCDVSIPFIAGQWSLRGWWAYYGTLVLSFNPLHCGAVVASPAPRLLGRGDVAVSIPFIAGQWSLPCACSSTRWKRRCVSIPFIAGQWSLPPRRMAEGQGGDQFQSPSLRGSGRFL